MKVPVRMKVSTMTVITVTIAAIVAMMVGSAVIHSGMMTRSFGQRHQGCHTRREPIGGATLTTLTIHP
jgi:hypothetical protein